MNKLRSTMTVEQFDRGYWYAAELQQFAVSIGIPSARALRKDQLERAIKIFLRSAKIEGPIATKRAASAPPDSERGLRLNLAIANYRNDRATWDFVEQKAQSLAPGFKRRSGARYRLNRWREQQIAAGRKIAYGDLVREYIRLSQSEKPFAQIPSGRYINFLSDFFAAEKNANREQALRAWAELKKLDVPKTYRSWAALKTRA